MPGEKLRIVKYPWHTGHDYELSKLRHDLCFLSSTPRRWSQRSRPIPDNIEWISSYGDGSAFDSMILHLDQWSYHEVSKRGLFLQHRDRFPGPKIVINHGCNMLDGCSSKTMRDLVDGCYMVCNSRTALDLWNVPNSRFILHGMSPEEWPQTDYAHNNVVVAAPDSRLHRAYRNIDAIERAQRRVPVTWIGRDKKFRTFEAYRHFLASSTAFFQPSFASPNPRSRTEAMLCGLVVITTGFHGEEEFITHGVNGFVSNDMEELLDCLDYVHSKPDEARRVGRAGRETAQSFFHIDRFLREWDMLLKEVMSG